MKSSKQKRYNLRKQREARIRRLYKEIYNGFLVSKNFSVISKQVIGGNYLLLCKDKRKNGKHAVIFKITSTNPISFHPLSPSKVLNHKGEIKKWLNAFNSSWYSKRLLLKLVLREDGSIAARSTVNSYRQIECY